MYPEKYPEKYLKKYSKMKNNIFFWILISKQKKHI